MNQQLNMKLRSRSGPLCFCFVPTVHQKHLQVVYSLRHSLKHTKAKKNKTAS